METTIPLLLSQKLARAKSLLRRDESIRGVDALISGIESYSPKNLLGKVRFEIEVLIQECVSELNRQPPVRNMFQSLAKSSKVYVPYTPGKEDKLMETLQLVKKALENGAEQEQLAIEAEHQKRKMHLEHKGLSYLKSGDLSRGKASLRILAEEFGDEPDLLVQVGGWLVEYKLYFEAAEILEQAIEHFHKDNRAYQLAIDAYSAMGEREKLESVYIRALKEFGRHPRTLLNLARVYQSWNKREEAFQLAKEAWDKDNSLTEAREIVDKNT